MSAVAVLCRRGLHAVFGNDCTVPDVAVFIRSETRRQYAHIARPRVVSHPREWEWCGYHELVGRRKRYRMMETERILELLGGCAGESLVANHEQAIDEAITARDLDRNPIWTESIAVGCKSFVSRIEAQTQNRVELTREETGGQWVLRETVSAYG